MKTNVKEAETIEGGTMAATEPQQTAMVQAPSVMPAAAPQVSMSEPASIINLIERAARDPAVDIDKMERLMAMRDRMLEREAKIAFDVAFAEMQPKLPVIERKGRISGESKRTGDKLNQAFGRWEDISPAVVPVLSAHGFGIRFEQLQVKGEDNTIRTRITCFISHSGHRESAYFDLPLDTSGSKNNVQAYGSTASYGRRYSAMLALNIVTRGEDDDANASGGGELVNEDQIEKIRSLIVEVAADIPKFCKYMKVARIEDIPAAKFKDAITALEAKRGAK